MIYHNSFLSEKIFNKCTPFPYRITWDLTYDCNLRCKHCFVIHQNEKNVSAERVNNHWKIAQQVVNSKPFIVSMAGGEPFLVPELIPIAKFLTDNGIQVIIATNGLQITERDISFLKKLNNLSVQISIDGAFKETHEYIRGAGTFDKTVSIIKAFSDFIPVTIAFTITRQNYLEIYEMCKMSEKIGAKYLKIQRFIKTDSVPFSQLDTFDKYENIVNDQLKKFYSSRKKLITLSPYNIKKKYNLIEPDNIRSLSSSSSCKECTITPYGYMISCGANLENEECDEKLNILNNGLINSWKYFFQKTNEPCGKKSICTQCI